MPRCPLCGSAHIVVTFRPERRGHCFGCDLQWGLDGGPSAEAPRAEHAAPKASPGDVSD